MSYSREREAVSRIRSLRQDFADERRNQKNEKDCEAQQALSKVAQPLVPITANYGDMMQLIGPTNYPAMVELFRGSNGLPDGIHPEVNVSFELFEAIQKRLVATRDELEQTRKELQQKSQQLAQSQSEISRLNERNTTLSRDLKQAEELCLELRRYSSDASILKQQHESDIIGFKDEIAGLVTRLNAAEKQLTESHFRVSETLVQLAQKDAVISSLKRGTRHSVAPVERSALCDDGNEPKMKQRSSSNVDKVFQDQLKQHITQLEREKKLLEEETHELLDMHEGYRTYVEQVIQSYEIRFMAYEDIIGNHRCVDSLACPKVGTALCEAQNVAQLSSLCESVLDTSLPTISLSSEFNAELTRVANVHKTTLSNSSECLHLLGKLDELMQSCLSIGELKGTWHKVQENWCQRLGSNMVACNVEFVDSVNALFNKENEFIVALEHRIDNSWVERVSTGYRKLVPVTDVGVGTVTIAQEEVEMKDVMLQCGPRFFIDRVHASTLAQQPTTAITSVDVATQANHEGQSKEVRSPPTPMNQQVKHDSPDLKVVEFLPNAAKFMSLHSSVVMLGSVVKKLTGKGPHGAVEFQSGQGNTLAYIEEFNVPLDKQAIDEAMDLDIMLVKAAVAALVDDPQTEARFASHFRKSEVHRLDKTVVAINALPPATYVDAATRADVEAFKSARPQLLQPETGFDDGTLQKYVNLAMESQERFGKSSSFKQPQLQQVENATPAVQKPQKSRVAPSPRSKPHTATTMSRSQEESEVPGTTISSSTDAGYTQEIVNDDWGATSQEIEERIKCPVIRTTPPQPAVTVPASTRRIPFKSTPEERFVEQVRTTPVPTGPTLQTKLDEAVSFTQGKNLRRDPDQPLWASSTSPVISPRNSKGSPLPSPKDITGHLPTEVKPLVCINSSPVPQQQQKPRPAVVLQSPTRTAKGDFNVVDSNFFFRAEQLPDEEPDLMVVSPRSRKQAESLFELSRKETLPPTSIGQRQRDIQQPEDARQRTSPEPQSSVRLDASRTGKASQIIDELIQNQRRLIQEQTSGAIELSIVSSRQKTSDKKALPTQPSKGKMPVTSPLNPLAVSSPPTTAPKQFRGANSQSSSTDQSFSHASSPISVAGSSASAIAKLTMRRQSPEEDIGGFVLTQFSPRNVTRSNGSPVQSMGQSNNSDPLRPVNNPPTSALTQNNRPTAVYRQTVHGHVTKKPSGADVLLDLTRQQREKSVVERSNSIAILDQGITECKRSRVLR